MEEEFNAPFGPLVFPPPQLYVPDIVELVEHNIINPAEARALLRAAYPDAAEIIEG